MIKTHHILKIYPLKRTVHFTYLEHVLVRENTDETVELFKC